MKKYIVDTSVIAKLFLLEEGREQAIELFRLAGRKEAQLIAPSLMLYELNNTLICEGFTGQEIAKCLGVWTLPSQYQNSTI